MKRYDLNNSQGDGWIEERVDGDYVLYEDHAEAMKRIAGDGAQQGLTAKQRAAISYAILAINSKPGWAGWQTEELNAMLAAPSASAQQAEPVAWMVTHPDLKAQPRNETIIQCKVSAENYADGGWIVRPMGFIDAAMSASKEGA